MQLHNASSSKARSMIHSLRFLLLVLGCFVILVPPAHTQPATPSFARGVNVSHWLAQMPAEGYGDPDRFDASDMRWIADHGFDHVRIPVDGRVLLDEDGKLIAARLEPFQQALGWAREKGLGVIFDMHYLEGANFTPVDNSLFASPELQARAASLWRQVASLFADVGDELRFEVFNEGVAEENEQLNELNALLLGAVREASPERVVYVSSNRWGQFQTARDVRVFDDPNVHYVFHYYEPFIFTHQGAGWTELPRVYSDPVEFPTTLTDLDQRVPEGHWIRSLEGVPLDRARIDRDFAELASWAAEHDVRVLISEFGVYNRAPRESAYRWTRAVRDAAERHGFGWSVWDYEGGFALRGTDGEPTVVHQALMSE